MYNRRMEEVESELDQQLAQAEQKARKEVHQKPTPVVEKKIPFVLLFILSFFL